MINDRNPSPYASVFPRARGQFIRGLTRWLTRDGTIAPLPSARCGFCFYFGIQNLQRKPGQCPRPRDDTLGLFPENTSRRSEKIPCPPLERNTDRWNSEYSGIAPRCYSNVRRNEKCRVFSKSIAVAVTAMVIVTTTAMRLSARQACDRDSRAP